MKNFEKHEFNIYPDINSSGKEKLKQDLKEGYDKRYPILVYNDKIIDGWQRYSICKEEGIEPIFEYVSGNELEILKIIHRSNHRRDMTSSQWAAVAVKDKELMKKISNKVNKEKKEKQRKNANNQYLKKEASLNKLSKPKKDKNETQTDKKIAEQFNTNRQYINDMENISKDFPEYIKPIEEGKISIPAAKQEIKNKIRESNDPNNPFFEETSRLMKKTFDKLKRIQQGDIKPKTNRDFQWCTSINSNLRTLVETAFLMGIDIKLIYEKWLSHKELKIPEHLINPYDKNKDIEDANIIN